ncbi:hypothetical protein L7F22_040514 [Adiantum nelumboides]|nr:hypothetical protein [Adiantum nelumboides]
MADRPNDVTKEVSSLQGRQMHEVGESSRPPQTHEEIFRTQLVPTVTMFSQVMQNPRFLALLQSPPPSQPVGTQRLEPNGIPVFCPALTDGSLGDMLYFHSFRNPGLVIDIIQDVRAINGEAVHASPQKTGIIILGGGLPKHHICNANMMRNGADFAVFINTGQEFDGSDSGAQPDEAVSWGKIRGSATPVKVHCDATIAFPLLVAQTFAKRVTKN